RADRGDDGIHVLRGKTLALRRAAGLHENRAPLWRARRVERPTGGEKAALEIDGADLRVIDENARLAIHDDRVSVPRRPELAHHTDHFVGHLVAHAVHDM